MNRWILTAALLGSIVALGWTDDNWAEFRGPGGTGHSNSVGLPREWSESQNVVWKTPIHDYGWSSPVVWGKQVWLTTATKDGKDYFAICLDRETGKVILDVKLFHHDKAEDTLKFNSFASPTPVIEEDRVYISFGSYGTACLSTDTGKVIWKREDLKCNHWRGPGSSPILYKNLVILHFDGYDFQYVIALDKKTGKEVWRADRKHKYPSDDGDIKKGYTTPIIIEVNGKPQLISPAAQAVVALDPVTGEQLWIVRYNANKHGTGARPQYVNGLLYINTGFPAADLIAIRPDGKGDVTDTHVAWKVSKGIGSKPSPLIIEDLIYSADDKAGGIRCLDAKTGADVWNTRFSIATASPLYADGVIYVFSEKGETVILQPGREYKEVGKGKLDSNGRLMGTPAIAGKSIFVRTETHLYRLEKK